MQLGFLDITLPNLGLNIWHPINIYQNKNIMTYMKSCYPTANLKKWDGRWESFGKNKLKFPQSGAYLEQGRSEEHTSELQSRGQLVCRLLLEKKTLIQLSNYQFIMNNIR